MLFRSASVKECESLSLASKHRESEYTSETAAPESAPDSEDEWVIVSVSDTEDRPLSPDSEPEYRPMSLETALQMADARASSPESMPEVNQNRSLSPDSPIPQFKTSCEYITTYIKHRSSSPESMASDSEYELMVTSTTIELEYRPSSPESIASVTEFQRLSPDSPVPEFMKLLSQYFMEPIVDGSYSPVSVSSDTVFEPLPVESWDDAYSRPTSPESES